MALFAFALSGASAPSQDAELDRVREGIRALPGMGSVDVSEIVASDEPGCYVLETPSKQAAILAFQTGDGAARAWHVAIRFDRPQGRRLSDLLPALDDRLLGNPELSQTTVVSSGADERVELESLPRSLRAALTGFDAGSNSLEWKRGATFYATCQGDADGILRVLGGERSDGAVARVFASVDAGTVAKALKAAGFEVPPPPAAKDAARWSLGVILPETVPFPFAVAGDKDLVHMVQRATRLALDVTSTGSGASAKTTWTAAGSQQIRLWIGGRQIDVESTIGVKAGAADLEVTRTGKATVDWKDAFGVPGLDVRSVSLSGKVTNRAAEKGATGGEAAPATRERSNAVVDEPAAGGRPRSDANADLGPNPSAGASSNAPGKDPVLDLGVGLGLRLPHSGDFDATLGVRVGSRGITDLSLRVASEQGLDLGALPGLRELPAVEDLRVTGAEIGIDRIAKDCYFAGSVAWPSRGASGRGAIVSFTPKGGGAKAFVLFLQTEDATLGTLVPSLPATVGSIALDRGMIAISSRDFDGLAAQSMAAPVKEMIASITGTLERKIPVFKGLTLFTRFDPGAQKAAVASLCTQLGVTEPLVLAGSLGGLADKAPSIALYADMPTLPLPKDGPLSRLRAAAEKRGARAGRANVEAESAGARLFVVVRTGAGGNSAELGTEGRFAVRIGDDDLTFAGRLYAVMSAISQGMRVAGSMEGEWDAPLGLEGIVFRDLVIGGGVDADSSVELALGGQARFGKLDYELAGMLSLVAASGGLVPKKVALKFEGSELSALTQVQIMSAFVKAAVSGPIASAIPEGEARTMLRSVAQRDLLAEMEKVAPLPMLELRDVGVYLVTPGASFPGLDLNGMGIGVHGTLAFMNRELGSVHDYLTLADGYKVEESLGDVDLGVFTLRNARIDFRIPMPGLLNRGGDTAHLSITGTSAAGCSAVSGEVAIAIDRDTASFATEMRLADYAFHVDASADLARWPDFRSKADGAKELVADVAEVVKEEAARAANAAKAAVEKEVAAAKSRVEAMQAAREAAADKARAEARKQVEAKVAAMRSGVDKLAEKHADKPALKAVLGAASDAAGAVKVAKNGAVEGADKLRGKLQDARTVLSKLPKALGDEVRSAVDDARSRLDSAVALAGSIEQQVKSAPLVQKAEADVEAAKRAASDAKALVHGKVAPVAAFATTALDTLTITKVGFDSDLSALCKGRMPKLSVWGTFKGQPFELREALELARKSELAAKNKANLQKAVAQLFDQLDPADADAFVAGLAK